MTHTNGAPHPRRALVACAAFTAFMAVGGTTAAKAQETKPSPAPSVASPSPVAPSPSASPAASPAAATATPKAGEKPASPAATAGKPGASPSPAASPAASVAAAPQPPVVIVQVPQAAPAPEPTTNSWVPGVLGIALLGGGIFYGMRYLKKQGMTVPDALQKMGVEMPQDGVAPATAHLKPPAPVLPPLPSLSELPSAGPSAGVVAAPLGGGGIATAPVGVAAPVRSPNGMPRLVGVFGPVQGATFDLTETFTVGRDAANSLALTQDTTISRHHAQIEPQGGGWTIVDAGSSNGTFVNGQRVAGSQPLQSGDEVQVGTARFRYEA